MSANDIAEALAEQVRVAAEKKQPLHLERF